MLGFDNISAYFIEELFNLKFAAKDLERNAKKSEKSEKEEKNKLKKVKSGSSTDTLSVTLLRAGQ